MSKYVVMCVDDEPQILESLRRDLGDHYGEQYEIETCESAEEGLEVRDEIRAEGRRVLVYIVDQRMPGMKGIEFLERVDEPAGKILLTAYADTEVAIAGINRSCIDFYLMKPYDEGLYDKVDHLAEELRNGYYIVEARTDTERLRALQLMAEVFAGEFAGGSAKTEEGMAHEDSFADGTRVFVAVRDKAMVGTTSLNRADLDVARKRGLLFGLPLEEQYDLTPIAGLDEHLVQVRGAAILEAYQHLGIGPQIWRAVARRAVHHRDGPASWAVINAGSKARTARDALLVLEKAKRLDLYDGEHEVRSLHPPEPPAAPLSEDDIEATRLPRLVSLYAAIGFRFNGQPCLYPSIGSYGYPMILDLASTQEPFRSLFFG